jgi:hypothetical protein
VQRADYGLLQTLIAAGLTLNEAAA